MVPAGSEAPYIVDFICPEANLIVELDGGQHSEQLAYDARRTAFLEGLGLRVLRFWNFEVNDSRDDVCRVIIEACGGERGSGPSPDPLPSRFAGGEEVGGVGSGAPSPPRGA
jgi:hypothetical protein